MQYRSAGGASEPYPFLWDWPEQATNKIDPFWSNFIFCPWRKNHQKRPLFRYSIAPQYCFLYLPLTRLSLAGGYWSIFAPLFPFMLVRGFYPIRGFWWYVEIIYSMWERGPFFSIPRIRFNTTMYSTELVDSQNHHQIRSLKRAVVTVLYCSS